MTVENTAAALVTRLGGFGVWRSSRFRLTAEQLHTIEALGYGTIWIGGTHAPELDDVEEYLDATETVLVASGIVNIWNASAAETARSYHRIEAAHPGRFLLGIGTGHREATPSRRTPLAAAREYLDVLDAEGVPTERRVLAALGPKTLELARMRTLGAHPYLTNPRHTAEARSILGPDALLATEQKVVLDSDLDSARAVGREAIAPYLGMTNYVSTWMRIGFTEADVANGGSERLLDTFTPSGTADQLADRLRAHLDAGANHVPIHVLPSKADPLPTLEALAEVLFR